MGMLDRVTRAEPIGRITHLPISTERADALVEALAMEVARLEPALGGVDVYMAPGEVTAGTLREFGRTVRKLDWFASVRTQTSLGREEYVVHVPHGAARVRLALLSLLIVVLLLALSNFLYVAQSLVRYDSPLDALRTRLAPLWSLLGSAEL